MGAEAPMPFHFVPPFKRPKRYVLVPCLLLAAACKGDDRPFPPNFQFGTAVAGFQVEMGCPSVAAAECEDRNADWYAYITTPELLNDPTLYLTGDPPSVGPGFYELYPQDIARAADELGTNALRISIEWSRLFPTSTEAIAASDFTALRAAANPTALTYYHNLLQAMRQRGQRPLVTINHYSLPTWIHDTVACHRDLSTCTARGWVDRDRIVREITKYAGFLAREFGNDVDLWATLNEPFTAVVVAGYLLQTPTRTNPPGVALRSAEAKTATLAMIEAHARMYDAVKQYDTVDADSDGRASRVGLVYNITPVQPANPNNPVDVTGASNLFYLLNQVFLDGVARGRVDANFDGNQVTRDDLAGRMDYIGLNYYTRTTVRGTQASPLPDLSPLLTVDVADISNLQFDYAYPQGLYESINFVKGYGLPIIITETGFEDPSDTGTAARWVVETLTWTARAIREGAPVEGYYYWTLMDNYEWNHGADIRLGLYAVDKNDPQKVRRARKSAPAYRRIIQARDIPADLMSAYPPLR
jgi:beta-galactosidase